MEFGLVGKTLKHSFSQQYFTDKFARLGLPYSYKLIELENLDALPHLLASQPNLLGLNVTIPYKEAILGYATELSLGVQAAGAANTLVRLPQGGWGAYNTDTIGFTDALKEKLESLHWPMPQSAWVLGTGGASKAVQVALGLLEIPYLVAGRTQGTDLQGKPVVGYKTLGSLPVASLWVNTTPVGQYPLVENDLPLPYHLLGPENLVYDVVYNPAQTLFLQKAAAQGAATLNGLPMLYGQAEAAWAIWHRYLPVV